MESVKKMKSGSEIEIQQISGEFLDEAVEVIEKAWNAMDRKEWFVVDGKEVYEAYLKRGEALLYRAYDPVCRKTAGVFLAVLPGNSSENMGRDIGLSETELESVEHMDTAAVLPEYRGRGLQYALMQKAESDLKERGYRTLICTVHPDNKFSREKIRRQGYELAAVKEKYGGFLREIWVRGLTPLQKY